jgi:hypothetical protein
MAGKFNKLGARSALRQPLGVTGKTMTTYEGGSAFERDDKSALLMLAVTNMVSEDTFYENAKSRDDRYSDLVHRVAVEDPAWTLDFLTWLRGSANMRSASLVGAAEAVKARLSNIADIQGSVARPDGFNRKIVNAVLQRADEPGEFLAYWASKYGEKFPMAVKRGVADAVKRLYTQRAFLKYGTESGNPWSMARVVELTHPDVDSQKPYQGDLFEHMLDRRHNPDTATFAPSLYTLLNHEAITEAAKTNPRVLYDADLLRNAGITWEQAIPLAGRVKADKRKVWQAMIPNMGIMALIRNLRNFDEAEVSDVAVELILSQLADPQMIENSRQFPYRFFTAYQHAPSNRWKYALDKALTLSTANIPKFPGRTLVLVDTSASMNDTVSGKSQIRRVDVAALFAFALAAKGNSPVDLYGFADGVFHHPLVRAGSVLEQTSRFTDRVGEVGHGTNTVHALRTTFSGHDRVVIFHDGQYGMFAANWPTLTDSVPLNVPLFGVDLAGYGNTSLDLSTPNRYEIGGFSDKMFTTMDLLSRGRSSGWPWEV